MTMSLGGVTIPLADQADLGGSVLPFTRKQRWVSSPALGLTGSIQQLMGTDPYRPRLHLAISSATKASLQALYDAQASGGGPYAFVYDDMPEPYATGYDVNITEFEAVLSEGNRGLGWFDLTMGMEEVV